MNIHEGPFTALIPDEASSSAPIAPLVLIMGWAGAQDKALRKYADLIASWGLPSIRSVQPASLLFSPIALPRRRWAERLLAFAASLPGPRRPLILYAFSNGGAFIVEQIAQLAAAARSPDHAHLRRSILGCIFDSAPAYLHPGLAEQVEAQVVGESGEGLGSGLARAAQGAALRAMAAVGPLITGNRAQQFWEYMKGLEMGPMLFLYSMDDPLCDGRLLAELIAAKRAAGHDVAEVCWQSSEHCGHLKLHRDEYETALRRHFEERLGAQLGKNSATPSNPPPPQQPRPRL